MIENNFVIEKEDIIKKAIEGLELKKFIQKVFIQYFNVDSFIYSLKILSKNIDMIYDSNNIIIKKELIKKENSVEIILKVEKIGDLDIKEIFESIEDELKKEDLKKEFESLLNEIKNTLIDTLIVAIKETINISNLIYIDIFKNFKNEPEKLKEELLYKVFSYAYTGIRDYNLYQNDKIIIF